MIRSVILIVLLITANFGALAKAYSCVKMTNLSALQSPQNEHKQSSNHDCCPSQKKQQVEVQVSQLPNLQAEQQNQAESNLCQCPEQCTFSLGFSYVAKPLSAPINLDGKPNYYQTTIVVNIQPLLRPPIS
ncbi:hypothetical protein C2869_21240 [Saccharobesus litoralis]|uniref:Uncharacterized protein n=1 Tax=Saccharobesus litoralis TaxID=2172099 RepID=A0A2S0VX08_9ALTE|nr:hypothetical protein [Saccharobesus litoralis]AWB68766.1 hypothetical protein C2869_21240 [Saccharobesus litoralis]